MAKNVSMISAMLKCSCPQCREGEMFIHKLSFSGKALKMHETCPKCGYKFEIEPGFFWGSMYISYAFSVAFAVFSSAFCYFVLQNPDTWVYLLSITLAMVLGSFISYRYSRVIMSYFFSGVKYKAVNN